MSGLSVFLVLLFQRDNLFVQLFLSMLTNIIVTRGEYWERAEFSSHLDQSFAGSSLKTVNMRAEKRINLMSQIMATNSLTSATLVHNYVNLILTIYTGQYHFSIFTDETMTLNEYLSCPREGKKQRWNLNLDLSCLPTFTHCVISYGYLCWVSFILPCLSLPRVSALEEFIVIVIMH